MKDTEEPIHAVLLDGFVVTATSVSTVNLAGVDMAFVQSLLINTARYKLPDIALVTFVTVNSSEFELAIFV